MTRRKPQLFLLHFAGGNSYSYRFLEPYLLDFELIPIDLPGRGRRMAEPLLSDLESASGDICKQIEKRIAHDDFILYGHSMGASLALKATYDLSKKGRKPLQLIVSGNSGPGRQKVRNFHQMDQHQFLQEITNLGGTPAEFLADPDLIAFFEPILRADFRIAEMRNNLDTLPPVDVPLLAIMGNEEEDVAAIANWSRFTTQEFESVIMQGNHFFIFDNGSQLALQIHNSYLKQKRPAEQQTERL